MWSRLSAFALGALVIAAPAFAQSVYSPRQAQLAKSLAPDVRTPQSVVERMLELAQVRPGEVVYDLGCGDGRILVTAVQRFKAKAVGVELSPTLAKAAIENIRKLGLQEMASVVQGDMREVDLSPADVVTLYLMTEANDEIKPRLEKYLKPGARVVSHDYQVRGWKAVRSEDSGRSGRFPHMIYVYQIPAKR